mgnify:CR=1 FL=1
MSMNLMERGLHLGGSAMLLIGAMRARSGLGRLALAAAAGGLLARAANGRNPGGQGSRPGHTLHLARTITIDRPPEELYAFWRNFENLPRIMRHLDSVRIIDAWRLLGENPQQQLDEDLQQFRRSMEGEGMPAAGPRTGRRDETRTT